jgi:hypothetical protein
MFSGGMATFYCGKKSYRTRVVKDPLGVHCKRGSTLLLFTALIFSESESPLGEDRKCLLNSLSLTLGRSGGAIRESKTH